MTLMLSQMLWICHNGTGQLIHTGDWVCSDAVIEYNCNYNFEGNNYSV